jgi:hypothetical protein
MLVGIILVACLQSRWPNMLIDEAQSSWKVAKHPLFLAKSLSAASALHMPKI